MNGLWNWIGAKPANVTMRVDPAPELLAQMEALWRECIADRNQPDTIIVPLWWFNKHRIPRRVHRWRGRRFVVSSKGPILTPEIAAAFGIEQKPIPNYATGEITRYQGWNA